MTLRARVAGYMSAHRSSLESRWSAIKALHSAIPVVDTHSRLLPHLTALIRCKKALHHIDAYDEADDAPTVPSLSSDEIQQFYRDLESDNEESFAKAIEALTNACDCQQDLVAEELITKIPDIFSLASTLSLADDRRSALIDLACKLISVNELTRAEAKPKLHELVGFLFSGSALNRYNITTTIEAILEDSQEDEAFQSRALELYKGVLRIPNTTGTESASPSSDPGNVAAAAETLQSIIAYSQERNRALAFKAGALDFLLLSTKAADPQARTMAISSLSLLYNSRSELAELASKDPDELQSLILETLIARLESEMPDGFLKSHPTFAVALIKHLARWDPVGSVPFPNIFYTYTSEGEDDNIVIDGFRRAFSNSDEVDVAVKLRLFSQLAHVYTPIREAAIKAEVVDFAIRSLGPLTEPCNNSQSPILHHCYHIEFDQTFGCTSLCGRYCPILSRVLAAATLSKLADSYSADASEPIRKAIVQALTSPDVLPAILEATEDTRNPQVAGAAFDLLSNILEGDEVAEESPKPAASSSPAALKDRIVTPKLISTLLTTLPNPANSLVAQRAADLLAQICYNHPTTYASAPFFAAFLPAEGGHAYTDAVAQVTKVVVDAGAFSRMEELQAVQVSVETGTIEGRRLAVKAMRALLYGEGVGKVIGRKESEHLPKLVASLVEDGSYESLSEAQKIVNQLHEFWVEDPFETWRDEIGKQEVVDSLLKALQTPVPEQASDDSELKKAQDASDGYDEIVTAACSLITDLFPLLTPFRTSLARTLFSTYFTTTRNLRPILRALEGFVESTNLSPSNPAYEPLVDALKTLLPTTDVSQALEQIRDLTRNSDSICIAFYLAGGMKNLVRSLDVEAQKADSPEETMALEIDLVNVFEYTIRRLQEHATVDLVIDCQQTFFSSQHLLRAVHKGINQPDDQGDEEIWAARQTLTWTHSFFNLTSGTYVAGLQAVASFKPKESTGSEGDSMVPRLLKLLNDEKHDPENDNGVPDIGAREAPLLGGLIRLGYKGAAEGVQGVLKGLVEGLVEPPSSAETSASSGGGKGKKKGKKGKKQSQWEPRISLRSVLERVYHLLRGFKAFGVGVEDSEDEKTEATKGIVGAVVKSGAVELALGTLDTASDLTNVSEIWVSALRIVREAWILGSGLKEVPLTQEKLSELRENLQGMVGEETEEEGDEESELSALARVEIKGFMQDLPEVTTS
ncbi:armadillo-type protein [Ephemerocybe angulata]|uniref:Armadillo-type protein n=1 Tax=Ephemerocybe angulata TaxID=980116 RepID=A0A8H6I5J6_9AGAR|nr:armadillo-type protein [Tulosesus angulatus]